jgi:hypothetical protein
MVPLGMGRIQLTAREAVRLLSWPAGTLQVLFAVLPISLKRTVTWHGTSDEHIVTRQ